MAGAIFNTIVPSSKKDRIVVNYGGIIKNQAWAKVDATYRELATAVKTSPNVTLLRSVNASGKKTDINEINPTKLTLYPTTEYYYFLAEGPEANSWWNEINTWVWEVKDSSGNVLQTETTSTTSKVYKFDKSLTEGVTYTLSVRGKDTAGNLTDPQNINIEVKKSIEGSTGGKDFNGDNLTIDIPQFINARPKKITLEVYLGYSHGDYKRDTVKLYNANTIFENQFQKVGGNYTISDNISITANTETNTSYDVDLTTGNITFDKVSYRLSKVILVFNYKSGVTQDEIKKLCNNLKLYYKNNCGTLCYLNATDTSKVTRKGVYSFKIEYGT